MRITFAQHRKDENRSEAVMRSPSCCSGLPAAALMPVRLCTASKKLYPPIKTATKMVFLSVCIPVVTVTESYTVMWCFIHRYDDLKLAVHLFSLPREIQLMRKMW